MLIAEKLTVRTAPLSFTSSLLSVHFSTMKYTQLTVAQRLQIR